MGISENTSFNESQKIKFREDLDNIEKRRDKKFNDYNILLNNYEKTSSISKNEIIWCTAISNIFKLWSIIMVIVAIFIGYWIIIKYDKKEYKT